MRFFRVSVHRPLEGSKIWVAGHVKQIELTTQLSDASQFRADVVGHLVSYLANTYRGTDYVLTVY